MELILLVLILIAFVLIGYKLINIQERNSVLYADMLIEQRRFTGMLKDRWNKEDGLKILDGQRKRLDKPVITITFDTTDFVKQFERMKEICRELSLVVKNDNT